MAETSLHAAAREGDVKVMAIALKAARDVNVADSEGMTPLMYASWYGHVACITQLLNAGAAINKFDHSGATALHYAAYNGQLGVVVALCESSADVSISDNDNMTALDHAMREGRSDISGFLRTIGEDQKLEQQLVEAEKLFNELREKSKSSKSACTKLFKVLTTSHTAVHSSFLCRTSRRLLCCKRKRRRSWPSELFVIASFVCNHRAPST